MGAKKHIAASSQYQGDRRWSARHDTCIEAQIHTEQHSATCIISTVSMTGMYLYTHSSCIYHFNHEAEILLELMFDYDDMTKHFFEMVSVVHGGQEGIAVRFDRYNNIHQRILQQLYHYIHEDNADARCSSASKQSSNIHNIMTSPFRKALRTQW